MTAAQVTKKIGTHGMAGVIGAALTWLATTYGGAGIVGIPAATPCAVAAKPALPLDQDAAYYKRKYLEFRTLLVQLTEKKQ